MASADNANILLIRRDVLWSEDQWATGGLTGRKIIDDHGRWCERRHGGGAFSEDPFSGSSELLTPPAGKKYRCRRFSGALRDPAFMLSALRTDINYGGNPLKRQRQMNYWSKLVREFFDHAHTALIKTADWIELIYRQTALMGHFGLRTIPLGKNWSKWKRYVRQQGCKHCTGKLHLPIKTRKWG